MIQIHKDIAVPAILMTKGARQKAKMEQLFRNGARRFDFSKRDKIYSDKTVKFALMLCQHDKCCFCEEKITHISFGHVEHYRPKGGFRQHEGDPASTFGYFWLAYEWFNLFLCCEICNSVFKRDFFPLENPDQRITDPQGDLTKEKSLILNPSEDPISHLEFQKWAIREKDGSVRGQCTIERTGLDRSKLLRERSVHYRLILGLANALTALRSEARKTPANLESQTEILKLIEEAMLPTARFSAMIRDNFAHMVQ